MNCLNCGALKADHISYPGRPLLCPTTQGSAWREKPTRVEDAIVRMLREHPDMNSNDIAGDMEMALNAAQTLLQRMKRAGLLSLTGRRDGYLTWRAA